VAATATNASDHRDKDIDRVLAGGGEAGALARSVDWSRTAIGAVEGWSQALRSTAALVLHNQSGMLLWWGPEFVQIYNDAYRPVLGDKHPRAMGQPFRECWAEVFHIVGPMAERPFRGGPASTSDDLPLLINRRLVREETHFRLAYSPVPDDTVQPTGVGGVLATVTEITEQAFAERQLRTLRELGARSAAEAATPEQACAIAAATLRENPWDVPFALFYLLDEGGKRARRVASVGFDDARVAQAAPREVELAADDAACAWPLRHVASGQRIATMEDLAALDIELPASPWSDRPRAAIVLPLASAGQANAYGVLVCGISPHRPLDAGYRTFFELAGAQIVTAIRNARALEEERRRAEALAQIDRAKTAFFSNISHEFRTPLTLMLGPTEDALGSPGRALHGAELETVHRNELRLLRLVNTLLDFSRIEAGRAQASYQPTDLAALTTDLASTFRSAIERGGLVFDVQCPPLPRPVQVDRQMWEKIVLNLLSNALKFTFQGSIAVAVRAAGDHVELEVKDTGIGIAEADLPRVFERFHRIEGARARTHEGSGIGLALVHDLVALHGGRVSVTSQLGQGTTFTVSIPFSGRGPSAPDRDGPGTRPALRPEASTAVHADSFVNEALRWLPEVPAEVPAAPAPPPAADGGAPGDAAPARPRVLFADDNADMREYVGRLLRQHWTVETVNDGAQALAAARARRPDVILTDVMMPELDGMGLLRALRGDPTLATIPVIMLSARAGEESRIEGLDAGADDYLVKPFSARELAARVGSQIALARAREDNARERAALFARQQVIQREAELQREHLVSLLMHAPMPVLILRGPRHVIELANPDTCRVWGRTHEQVIGRPMFEVLPELRGQVFEALLAGVLRTGAPHVGRETPARIDRSGDGALTDVYFNFVYSPMRNVAGEVDGVLVIAFDVTEEVTARQQIERLRGAAEAATRAKDEFLAMLGHELRNPLAPILTAVQLMRMRGKTGREVDLIDRQVRHLIRLVDDLLDVSRITRGMVELRRERHELARSALRGLEIASPLLEQRRQEVDFHVPALGLEVDGDPDRLAQVVSNLITNASKYSEPGTRIHVRAERAGPVVRLRCLDHGIGITADMLERIFDTFTQQPQALDRSRGGLGLGLAIVRSLVELHGGRVEARSDGPGLGSEFIVTLPLASPGALFDLTSPAVRGHPGAAPPELSASARRILIVDDNDDAAQSIADVLQSLGHDVHVAHDGPTALRVAAGLRPHVCLLDIGLPAMDGYELARRLRDSRDLPEGARIIAVTGYGQEADRRRSSEAGFTAHVVKPVDLDMLTSVLAN
jgi:PAS domain S-box-containing protein